MALVDRMVRFSIIIGGKAEGGRSRGGEGGRRRRRIGREIYKTHPL